MATWVWIVVVVAVLVIVAATVAVTTRQRRTAGLRERFGSEYDRTVESRDDQRAAEAELISREKRRAQFDIKPLSEASRVRYTEEWQVVQERFVDEPGEAAGSADTLVHRVMAERGYPVEDFSAQTDLVSVDFPEVAENYRVAHTIRERATAGQASTEDFREALLRYRSLFNELLGEEASVTGEADPAVRDDAEPIPPDTAPADIHAQEVPAQHRVARGGAEMEADRDLR